MSRAAAPADLAPDPKIVQWIHAELAKGNTPEVLYAALVQKGWRIEALKPYMSSLFGSEAKARSVLKVYGIEIDQPIEPTSPSLSLLTLTGFKVSQPAPSAAGTPPQVATAVAQAPSAAGSGVAPTQAPPQTPPQTPPTIAPAGGAVPGFAQPQGVALEGQSAQAQAVRLAQAQALNQRKVTKKKVERDFVYIDEAGNSAIRKVTEQEEVVLPARAPHLQLRGNINSANAAKEQDEGAIPTQLFILASRILWSVVLVYQAYTLFQKYFPGGLG